MPDPLTPAWIASRLTPAQRAALLWLPEDGSELRGSPGPGLYGALTGLTSVELVEHVSARLAYSRRGLGINLWSATPLGLRVRAVVAGGVG